jgi:hypothetical protein
LRSAIRQVKNFQVIPSGRRFYSQTANWSKDGYSSLFYKITNWKCPTRQ